MVHRVIDMGRGQPLLPDHDLAGSPPFLLVGAEEAEDCRNRGIAALCRRRASAVTISKYSTRRIGGVSAVTIETFVKFVGRGDQGRGGCRRWPVRRIGNFDKPVPLAVFYSLDASPDVRPIKAIKSAMDGSA